ncbi:Endonuclease YhcR precursor [Trueperella bernardiae]|uniref:Endonuclease YhcR n=1 Tax=Trueperella bernardiae TaxID=59561 RepID=A0A0W1KIU6_9ACTO|nr:bifunctional UDP-sugar hydrolase/5'-nucleotidase [Trueperella bernardiae]KTF03559.1 Endonuclease YhcR precursor [Trueperella bernardiae]
MSKTNRSALRSVSMVTAILLGTAALAVPASAVPEGESSAVAELESEAVGDKAEEAVDDAAVDGAEAADAEEADAAGDSDVANDAAQAADDAAVLSDAAEAAEAAESGDAAVIDFGVISDFHGAIQKAPAMAAMLDERRAKAASFDFLAVGDSVGGSTFESAIAKDVPTIDVLNAMGLTVSAVGNHEFDQGYADLRDRILDLSSYTNLGANVAGAKEIADPGYVVKTYGDVKVAFIGTVTDETPQLTSASAVEGLTFNDPVAVTDQLAKKIKESGEADAVVALMHDGLAKVETLGADVDLAFGGHTHIAGASTTASGAAVCQPGASGSTVVFAQLAVAADGKVTSSCENETVATGADAPVNDEIQALVNQKLEESAKLGAEELFPIAGPANRGTGARNGDEGANRGTESSAGNLIAQAFYEYGQTLAKPADFGVMNSGGIRADFDANKDGVVTFQESFNVQPFGNSYGTRVIQAKDVYELLEQQWKPGESRPILRLGLSNNIKYVYDPAAEYGKHILAVYLNGKLLGKDNAEITVASSSFLLDAGDSFNAFANAGNPVVDTGIIDHEVFNQVAQGWAANGAFTPDYTQRSFGYTGPLTFVPGQTVDVQLSSLAMTSTEPLPTKAMVNLNGVEVATADVDTTVTPKVDETGRAAVSFMVPADAELGAATLTIATDDGSTVDLPVTIRAAKSTAPNVATYAQNVYGEASGDKLADIWGLNGAGELFFYQGGKALKTVGLVADGFEAAAVVKVNDVNGDKRADFLVTDAAGDMFFYYSTGNGHLTKGAKVGHGWSGMDLVAYAGKVDGMDSVVARQGATGDLYRYAVSAAGVKGLGKVGHGWGAITNIVSVGNTSGSADWDLLATTADGALIAYETTPAGGLRTDTQKGHGWEGFTQVFSPGDMTGDGAFDLVGVRAGILFLYEQTGRGWFALPVEVGHGWDAMTIVR